MAVTFLEREDDRIEVSTATSASQGLDRFANGDFDCIVSDYDMPGRTGIEFLEAVREEHSDLPFILFTGKGSEEVASDAISAGATDYLQKEPGTDQYELLANRIRNAVDQYRAQQRATDLDRIRTLRSDINQALVRAESRAEAETSVCEIISASDPYLFVWIGVVDPDTERTTPRTSAGTEEGYLDAVTKPDGSLPEEGPGGTAIRERRVVVSQNVAEDPAFEPWREEALDRGYQAGAAIPLEYQDTLYGELAVYADRPNAFDEDERELLAELGADIAHACYSFEVQARLEAERDQRQALIENAPAPVIVGDIRGDRRQITDVNEAFEDVFGFTAETVVGHDIADVLVPDDEYDQHRTFRDATDTGPILEEVTRITADGPRDFLLHIIPYGTEGDRVDGWYAWYTDITERKAREQAIEELHDTARSCMQAGTPQEVADITVDAVRDILEMPINGVHFYDEPEERLVPVTWTEQADALLGDPPTFAPGEGLAWTAFETGDPQIHDDVSVVPGRYNPDTEIRSELILPLGEYGILTIGSTTVGAFDETDVSLAKLLAAHVTTALTRLEHERTFRQTRKRYRTLVEHFPDGGVFLYDQDLTCLLAGGQGLSDIGLTPDDIEGEPPRDRYPDTIANELEGHLRDAFQGEHAEFEQTYNDRHYRVQVLPIGDDAVTNVMAVSMDITGRKEQERKREQIIDRVTDAIVEVDADWQFTLVNDQAEELYDMDEETLLGRDFWEVFAEAQGTRFEEEYRDVMGAREPTSFTEYYSGLDGWFDVDVYPNDDGGVAFYFRDVTDRVERSRELERRSERFQYVEEVAEIGYWEIDARTPVPHDVILSDGVSHIHDLSPDEPFDVEKGLQFYHPEDRPTVERAVERAVSDGEPYDHEVRLITAEGRERWVHSVGEPIERDGEVVTVRGVFQDVTERKRKEQELARQNERLDQFVSVIAHDLQNPLNVAQGRLRLAREEYDSDDLEAAATAVDRGLGLIDDLLTLAREGEHASELEAVDLAELCTGCWRTVETADATLVNDATRTIRADPGRLKQLLENLFRNAVTHGGEAVTVTIGDLDDGFYIADDGPGIPADGREKVFETGYSTTDDGTGFGLNIVDEIAEAHGWEITLTDSEAGGARFEITDVEVR
ncbi:MAG: PAS domain S-box protein [Halobacteriales archaeon]